MFLSKKKNGNVHFRVWDFFYVVVGVYMSETWGGFICLNFERTSPFLYVDFRFDERLICLYLIRVIFSILS